MTSNPLRAEDALYTGPEGALRALPAEFEQEPPARAAAVARGMGRPVVSLGPIEPALQRQAAELDVQLWQADLGEHRLKLGFDSVAHDVETCAELVIVQLREPPLPKINWPEPIPASAWVGWLRPFMETVTEHTEADPNAVLVDMLVRIGCAIGRGPHLDISGDRHGVNLFALIVGRTGTGKKGQSGGYPRRIMGLADPTLAEKSGLSSGEGLIHAIRDDRRTGKVDKHGEEIVEPGVSDKRLLTVESEFARVLRVAKRNGSSLGQVLRDAWDSRNLASLTKEPYEATDPHVSVIAHVTPDELRGNLADDDITGGTVNRFLIIASRRSRLLPFGGELEKGKLQRLADELSGVLDFARSTNRMTRSPGAREHWAKHYAASAAELDQELPLMEEVLARGVTHCLRLAILMALLDQSRQIELRHVDAAIDVWKYSERSARWLFGRVRHTAQLERIVQVITAAGGRSRRSELSKKLKRSGREMDELAEQFRVAGGCIESKQTTGRPVEWWFWPSGQKGEGGEG